MANSQSLLQLTYNHIAFPPQLPGTQDPRGENVNSDLTRRLLDAVKVVSESSKTESLPTWKVIQKSLETCISLNENGFINKARLVKAFRDLQPDHALILHIVEQNACVLIRQSETNEHSVIFESFETSPSAEQTLAARGALQWDFPGAAASLPLSEFRESNFQESMASFLEKASVELLEEFTPKTRKAGVEVSETRDTVDPAIITQFFFTLLETKGCRVSPVLLRKRIKDDVVWDNSELPWRRSAYWLLLRVCIQRLLYLRLGESMGRLLYKFLMCTVIARLLDDVSGRLTPEQGDFLQKKLCRRLAKMATEQENDDYQHLIGVLGPMYQRSMIETTKASESKWNAFKPRSTRKIPRLPRWAGSGDLRLTLPNSGPYLQGVINEAQSRRFEPRTFDRDVLDQTKGTQQFRDLTSAYSLLAQAELTIETKAHSCPVDRTSAERLCRAYANEITQYLTLVGDAYLSDPEQMSIFILTLFELWVDMDKSATIAYPVLKRFHPEFNPDLLDVILLSRFTDLERLQRIQCHLHASCSQATASDSTIFSDPAPGCFADKFFDQENSSVLDMLLLQIEAACLVSRKKKVSELEQVNAQFHELTEKRATSTCTERQNDDGSHDIRGCSYCYYLRRRKRLKIQVHEDFLPPASQVAERRAVAFEMEMPKAISAYRNTTWEILNTLCPQAEKPPTASPECLLEDYSPLARYNKYKDVKGLSLASHTKSYQGTHYNWKRLPADPGMVLMPLGLRFSYFDSKRRVWVRDFPAPLTLAHHFKIAVPSNSPFANLYSSSKFTADGPGPSSYEAVASISECPSELTAHEFIAHQNLRAGKYRRWLVILAELGSSNVNFSTQGTADLLHQLILQAGPRSENDGETLRVVHAFFNDLAFCRRLIEKLHQHVESISANWRETTYMETMLTMAIQLYALGPLALAVDIQDLLLRIRRVTVSWVIVLRKETRNARQIDIAERLARFCFLSALLCRRTFYPHAYNGIGMKAESFKCFVEATLAMQESLVVDLGKFSTGTRNMLVRDIKMVARMKSTLLSSVSAYPTSLEAALDAAWPEADNRTRKYSDWEIFQDEYKGWVISIVQGNESTEPQQFGFHLLEGHFLINGQVLGKLPSDISDSETLKDLFGNQRLFAMPSDLPGMSYRLGLSIKDHHIHIGYRRQTLIVRAVYREEILELIPRHIFINGQDRDLPASAIFDCVHWLNPRFKRLEIRRKPRIWHNRPGNWIIDLTTRRASRRSVFLVDPHSPIFQRIVDIFSGFEEPQNLTVFQPQEKSLSIEIKRMDLSFYVNSRQLLHFKQLHAEIDTNQDIGTWFGLESSLVLRNPSQRMVITTMGAIRYRRQGMHVAVRLDNDGRYARYIIDKELGRLHCPPMPQLLDIKARLHAFTSSFLPDPLTGRTGTEEALSCLQSGCLQPWSPIPFMYERLKTISNLTPQREFYPKDKKSQQTVHWDSHLTVAIQHDAYQPLVEAIVRKSERLSLFSKQNGPVAEQNDLTVTHLRERAQWRRSIYERSDTMLPQSVSTMDTPYISRDRLSASQRISNVREVVELLIQRPLSISTTPDLTGALQGCPMIGGYANKFTAHVLQECITADLAVEWGGLVNMCKDCLPENSCDLMFHLGVVAFRNRIDMTMIRALVAFFLFEDLKNMEYPQCTWFEKFEINAKPTTRVLLNLTTHFRTRFEDVWQAKNNGKHGGRDKRRSEVAEEDHEVKCAVDHEKFVDFLIAQWPCNRPMAAGFETTYLDVEKSIEAVAPDWLRLHNNKLFADHLRNVQAILDRQSFDYQMTIEVPPCHPSEVFGPKRRPYTIPSLGKELLRRPGPKPKASENIGNHIKSLSQKWWAAFCQPSNVEIYQEDIPETTELEKIIERLMQSECPVRYNYARDLEKSIAALRSPGRNREQRIKTRPHADFKIRVPNLRNEISSARALISQMHGKISSLLSCDYPGAPWLQEGHLWPCLSPLALLEHLRSTSHCEVDPNVKATLILYGLAITKLQQLLRIQEALTKKDWAKMWQEYSNVGHTNWQPVQNPDWLLLELDSNIQIREDQVVVAREMVSPSSHRCYRKLRKFCSLALGAL
ncbi:uncharacterized protein LDX57_002546 [Aspergillus melleus]|uniref:uncharacterized protein n=1 Tax=Aspergillus melleus TaxID=138277 RepID=UPI001E8DA476|nr:uncharacterized protein LDX57_002546 [Aspergillus melleus]KAH8424803.1 hypothetical protein LDX57_002546 [Aspergillus melleus]